MTLKMISKILLISLLLSCSNEENNSSRNRESQIQKEVKWLMYSTNYDTGGEFIYCNEFKIKLIKCSVNIEKKENKNDTSIYSLFFCLNDTLNKCFNGEYQFRNRFYFLNDKLPCLYFDEQGIKINYSEGKDSIMSFFANKIDMNDSNFITYLKNQPADSLDTWLKEEAIRRKILKEE